MDPKDYLRKMINHTIDGDTEQAEKAFKDYLVPKTMDVLGIRTNSPAATPEDETVKTKSETNSEEAPETEAAASGE